MAATAALPATTPRGRNTTAAIDNHQAMDVPLDFSFFHFTNLADIQDEEPRPIKGKEIAKQDEKFNSHILRLNNNSLTDISDLMTVCESILQAPTSITWIDLSFNELGKINPVLCDLPTLKILYLHGNCICDIKEVHKLAGMANLRKLTLHGNEIANVKNYRWYVLAHIPQLNSFDMSTITKSEKATAENWKKSSPTKKKKASAD